MRNQLYPNIDEAAGGNAALHGILTRLVDNQKDQDAQNQNVTLGVPPNGELQVVGVDGHFLVTIIPGNAFVARTVKQVTQRFQKATNPVVEAQQFLHEVQSALDTKFDATSSVSVYGPSPHLTYDITDPNVTKFWRFRSSNDKGVTFNAWTYLSSVVLCGVVPVYSGLLRSWSLVPNASKNTSNNAKVDAPDVDAGSCQVRVYGVSGGPGTNWNRYANDASGAVATMGPYPSTSFAGKAYNTTYYVAYNPTTGAFICTTSFSDTLPDGYFWVGSATSNAAFGGGGGTSGGGGSGGGGTGGGGHGVLE